MCIKVTRWFYCPAQGQYPAFPPHRARTNTYRNFWTYWEHGETVGLHEQHQRNLPTHQGYRYVHHKDERWIRCAMTDVTACLQYPLEIRTELYDIACPECTQDDPGVLSAQPIHTYTNQSPGMTPDILASIAEAYAAEIIGLMTCVFRVEIAGQDLEESAWNVYQRGLYCTLEKEHIILDRPEAAEGPVNYPCFPDCVCTTRPWAPNASRAARNQDAAQVRIKRSYDWFFHVTMNQEPWPDEHFADMPNQLWLNMHEDGPGRYRHLLSQIHRAVSQVSGLGPSIEVGDEWTGARRPIEGSFDTTVNLGKFTATKLIALPSLDPGITADFLDLLMRNHFLTALCPHLDFMNDQVGILDCQRPASPNMWKLLAATSGAFKGFEKWVETSHALVRHAQLVDALGRNRAISHHNALIKKQTADGFALSCIVNSLHASGRTQTCPICADDFDDVNDEAEIPPHLRAIQTRCCGQFMHVRCLKGSSLRREKCPLCNRNLEEIGFSTERFAPGLRIEPEVRRGDLPAGMMDRPSTPERHLVEYHRDLLANYILSRIEEMEELAGLVNP